MKKLTDAQVRALRWIGRGKAFATRSSELARWRYWYNESELPGYSVQVAIRQETINALQKAGYIGEKMCKGSNWMMEVYITKLGRQYLEENKTWICKK